MEQKHPAAKPPASYFTTWTPPQPSSSAKTPVSHISEMSASPGATKEATVVRKSKKSGSVSKGAAAKSTSVVTPTDAECSQSKSSPSVAAASPEVIRSPRASSVGQSFGAAQADNSSVSSPASDSDTENELAEQRRQFHLACEQSRRRTIKDSLEVLKSEIPSCSSQKLTKANILSKAIEHVQDSKRRMAAMAAELNQLRAHHHAARSSCTCGAMTSVDTVAKLSGSADTDLKDEDRRKYLPDGWECIITPEGAQLYVDLINGVSQWTHPMTVRALAAASASAVPHMDSPRSINHQANATLSVPSSARSPPSLSAARPSLPPRLNTSASAAPALVAIDTAVLMSDSVSPLDSVGMGVQEVMHTDALWLSSPLSGEPLGFMADSASASRSLGWDQSGRPFSMGFISPLETNPMLLAGDLRADVYSDSGLSLALDVKRPVGDEGYHSREPSYHSTEQSAMETDLILA